jgi:hypothetical protein
MFNQNLRTRNEIFFSGKLDRVKISKKENQVIVEKAETGITGWLYALFFFLAGAVITYFAGADDRILIALLAGTVLLSAVAVIFFRYRTVIDFEKKMLFFERKIFLFSWESQVPFSKVIDWKVKQGEGGYQVTVKTGEALGLINRIREEFTVCRVGKLDEAADFVSWLREKIGAQ